MVRRVYATQKTIDEFPEVHAMWLAHIANHNAVVLKDGENPEDYPTRAVAYETPNFGWVLSAPDIDGKRHIMVQF